METALARWRPGLGMTGYDDASKYIGERLDGYFVYSKHRDSDALARSNYECILQDLQKLDLDHVEEHSFNHWAVGYVDQIVLVADASEAVIRRAEDILTKLADYPVFDEQHWSELEHKE